MALSGYFVDKTLIKELLNFSVMIVPASMRYIYYFADIIPHLRFLCLVSLITKDWRPFSIGFTIHCLHSNKTQIIVRLNSFGQLFWKTFVQHLKIFIINLKIDLLNEVVSVFQRNLSVWNDVLFMDVVSCKTWLRHRISTNILICPETTKESAFFKNKMWALFCDFFKIVWMNMGL